MPGIIIILDVMTACKKRPKMLDCAYELFQDISGNLLHQTRYHKKGIHYETNSNGHFAF